MTSLGRPHPRTGGRPPVCREDGAETLSAILRDDPPDVWQSGRTIPGEVAAVPPPIRTTRTGRPTVGLALSGGGARGFAHAGVLRALEECGVEPDVIAGASMGAFVGGLHAAGYTAAELERIALEPDWY